MAGAAADAPTTVIVNETRQALDMKVANHRHFADFASVAQGARHTMRVDYNDTYQEFVILGADVDVDNANLGKRLVVTSDDCCDCKCLTITETVDGRLHLHKEPRRRQPESSQPAPDHGRRPAKKFRLRRRVLGKKSLRLFTWGVMCQ